MSKKSEFRGLIQVMDDRSIRWFNTDKIQAFLKDHPNERFEFVIKKYRTPQQNKYLHVLIGMLADYLGYTLEEMKDIIKFKFLKVETVCEKTGEIFERIKDTRELSKQECVDLIEKIRRWSAEDFNYYLPDAGEELEMEFNK